MASLRSALIRLAHENPGGIREHLLPLLRRQAAFLDVKTSIDVGRWYGKPSSVAVVEGHSGRYAISLMQGEGLIQGLGDPKGYSSEQEAAKVAQGIARRLKRGDGSPLWKTASGADLDALVKRALQVIQSPWKATLVKATTNENVVGRASEFWVNIQAPRPRGTSLSPTVQLSPSFRFYVDEMFRGPKAGTFSLQSTWSFVGKPERLHAPMWLKSPKQVADQIARLLGEHGYERMSY